MFPHSTTSHEVKEDYIYQELSSLTYTIDTCSSLCHFHTPSTPACQFFILYDGKCMLGNFESTGTYSAPADSFTAYFNESEWRYSFIIIIFFYLTHLKSSGKFIDLMRCVYGAKNAPYTAQVSVILLRFLPAAKPRRSMGHVWLPPPPPKIESLEAVRGQRSMVT